jgi:hypothetical protein
MVGSNQSNNIDFGPDIILITSQKMCDCPECCVQVRKEKQASITHLARQANLTPSTRGLLHPDTVFQNCHLALWKPLMRSKGKWKACVSALQVFTVLICPCRPQMSEDSFADLKLMTGAGADICIGTSTRLDGSSFTGTAGQLCHWWLTTEQAASSVGRTEGWLMEFPCCSGWALMGSSFTSSPTFRKCCC